MSNPIKPSTLIEIKIIDRKLSSVWLGPADSQPLAAFSSCNKTQAYTQMWFANVASLTWFLPVTALPALATTLHHFKYVIQDCALHLQQVCHLPIDSCWSVRIQSLLEWMELYCQRKGEEGGGRRDGEVSEVKERDRKGEDSYKYCTGRLMRSQRQR